jgi:hypothetical protein
MKRALFFGSSAKATCDMKPATWIFAVWLGIACLGGTADAASPSSAAPWDNGAAAGRALETVELLDHRRYEGYIESENDVWIYMIQVQRPAGKAMHAVVRTIDQALVKSVKRLPAEQRQKLRQEIEQFVNRATIEAGRMEGVKLREAEEDGNQYHRYVGKWFTLDSTVDELTTRRMIVRVEQIFAAYRQMLTPRADPKRPLRLVVFGSMDEYQSFLGKQGIKIQNRACFLEQKNLVAAGTELSRFSSVLAKINAQNNQLRRQLDELKAGLPARLNKIAQTMQGRPQAEIGRVLTTERRKFKDQTDAVNKQLVLCDRENANIFAQSSNQAFTRLYHESFHAYLENYVYPHGDCDVPLWLNEGLAMVFECGVLDSEGLRIDRPTPAMLKRLQEDLAGGQPMPLEQLLAAGPANFLLPVNASPSETVGAGRHYVYAWGLAYYLAFETRLLSGAALDRYVQPESRKLTPVQRFEQLVGQPIEALEKQWREAMGALR